MIDVPADAFKHRAEALEYRSESISASNYAFRQQLRGMLNANDPENVFRSNLMLRFNTRPTDFFIRMATYALVPTATVWSATYLAEWAFSPNSQLFGTSTILKGVGRFTWHSVLGTATFIGFSTYWLAKNLVQALRNQLREDKNENPDAPDDLGKAFRL